MYFLVVLPSLRFWETGRHPGSKSCKIVGLPWPRCLQGHRGQSASGRGPSHQGLIASLPLFSHPLHRYHPLVPPIVEILVHLGAFPNSGQRCRPRDTPAGGSQPPAGARTAGQGSAELCLSQYLRPPPPRAELRLGKNQKQLGCFPALEAGVGVLRRGWKPWCLFSPSLSTLLPLHWSSLSPAESAGVGVGGCLLVGKRWRGVVSWKDTLLSFYAPLAPPHNGLALPYV